MVFFIVSIKLSHKVLLSSLNCFLDYKRDNIDVKKILLNLENKQLFKRGKYIKAGNRTIDGWVKILPEPTNAEQIKSFDDELKNSYQFTLEKYIDYYEKGVDNKSSLSEATGNILSQQRSWISELREKILGGVVEQNNSGRIFCKKKRNYLKIRFCYDFFSTNENCDF